jgi:hypothetical protein
MLDVKNVFRISNEIKIIIPLLSYTWPYGYISVLFLSRFPQHVICYSQLLSAHEMVNFNTVSKFWVSGADV